MIYSNEIIFGCFCGFVVGAKGICRKYKNGYDINDFNRGIFLSSNAGIGFVIGCIGCVLYEDILFGFYLYIIQIFSGLLIYKLVRNRSKRTVYIEKETNKGSIVDIFVKSIKTSTNTVLSICGFSLFFSVINDLILSFFNLENNMYYSSFIQTFLDFSKGAFQIVKIDDFTLRNFLIGFCVGFGGICTYMQICAECENYPFKKIRFLILKFTQGMICGVLSLIYFKFSGKV